MQTLKRITAALNYATWTASDRARMVPVKGA